MHKNMAIIDLHLHLDGALSVESVKELAEINKIALPNDEELKKLLTVSENCRDLTEFLDKFSYINQFLQTGESIKTAVYNLLEEEYKAGLKYVEIRFAPSRACEQGLTQREVIEAAIEGLNEAKLPANLILCLMRGEKEEINKETVDLAKEYLGKGVVAIDLAGAEALFPTEDYLSFFEYAEKLEVPYIIHSGEASGPESVWAALKLHPLRIGHGVKAIEDMNLVQEIAKRGILLEMCPTSNLNTQAIRSIEEFPLREYQKANVKFSINTDDPGIEGTTLAKEFALVSEHFKLSDEELKQMVLNAIEASFASDELKEELRKSLEA